METADGLDAEASAALWNNLASGAESGWDFSSRWFANGQNLSTIRITELVPADLNAYLYQVSEQSSVVSGGQAAAQVTAMHMPCAECVCIWACST